jgi:hypothetical protein
LTGRGTPLAPVKRGESSGRQSQTKSSAGLTNWNDIPADELKQFMDEIDAVELRPDEAELEGWLENQLS